MQRRQTLPATQHLVRLSMQREETIAMKTFHMIRDEDVTGYSGTGTVAEGIEFDDGTVVIRWLGQFRSTVVWDNIDHAIAVHGHDGKTTFIFTQQYE